MCGIFAFFANSRIDTSPEYISSAANNLVASLYHRGPDDSGVAFWNNGFIGNTRLSIIDIQGGKQPFVSSDGKITVVQNGEIFNYKSLCSTLAKQGFYPKTDSDTETILLMYECFGIDMVQYLEGMFSIIIKDDRNLKLFLIRDRIGEKPLYYFNNDSLFVAASEINAVVQFIQRKSISVSSVLSYLSLNYIPQPSTIFKDVKSVLPGSYLEVVFSKELDLHEVSCKHWWSPLDLRLNSISSSVNTDELYERLKRSVSKRITSDVPISLLLSGGIDSSIIAVILSELNVNLNAYTIHFNDNEDPELKSARLLARDLSLDYTEINGNSNKFSWSEILNKLGQPYGDTSFNSLFAICNSVGEHYKVALTGDGSDEIFAGYLSENDFNSLQTVKPNSKALIQYYLNRNSVFSKNQLNNLIDSDVNLLDVQFQKVDEVIDSQFRNLRFSESDSLSYYLYLDLKLLLLSNNLVKSDMCSMANKLEIRSPFLEIDILEIFFALSSNQRIGSLGNKHILRELLSRKFNRYSNLSKKKFSYPFISSFNDNYKLNISLLSQIPVLFPFIRMSAIQDLIVSFNKSPHTNYRCIRNLLGLAIWSKSLDNFCLEYDI